MTCTERKVDISSTRCLYVIGDGNLGTFAVSNASQPADRGGGRSEPGTECSRSRKKMGRGGGDRIRQVCRDDTNGAAKVF